MLWVPSVAVSLPACPCPPFASAPHPSPSHGSSPAADSGALQGSEQPWGHFQLGTVARLVLPSGAPPAGWTLAHLPSRGVRGQVEVPGAAAVPASGGRTLDAGVADSAFGPGRSFCLRGAGLRSQFAAAKRPVGGRSSSVPQLRVRLSPLLCPHSLAHPRRMTACPSGAGQSPVPQTTPLRTPSPSALR